MKLAEALSIVQTSPADGTPFPILLGCGFSPLHLQTFLAAHVQTRAAKKVQVQTGLFGDLAGTLEQTSLFSCDAGAVFLEWSDLDTRLGYRALGGWGERTIGSVLSSVEAMLARVAKAICGKRSSFRLILSLPTLPLPPAFHTIGLQASVAETSLAAIVSDFAGKIASQPGLFILNKQKLGEISPPAERYDFRSDLNTGFPYTLKHTDLIAEAAAALLTLPPPKKGLISDLDNTMWRGIVGEDGPDGVAWDLAGHAQVHGLYQQMLQSLADQGVLLGIASKNNQETAEQALHRGDFLLQRERMFPVEIHWEPKSRSIMRILKTWNVAADSVVFIDDSPMELEEVRAVHPGIECILFTPNDYTKSFALLQQLRDLFGKPTVSQEDSIRLESIRNSQHFLEGTGDGNLAEKFLASAQATVTFELNPSAADTRVLELVNKTNQFNLNGKRYSEAEWQQLASAPGAFVIAVSYLDKFGPLGKISVLLGREDGGTVTVESWVLSCRAFSRRIEHRILDQIFRNTNATEIRFRFTPTSKNGPTHDFLAGILGPNLPAIPVLERSGFAATCPTLYHQVAFNSRDEESKWTIQKRD